MQCPLASKALLVKESFPGLPPVQSSSSSLISQADGERKGLVAKMDLKKLNTHDANFRFL